MVVYLLDHVWCLEDGWCSEGVEVLVQDGWLLLFVVAVGGLVGLRHVKLELGFGSNQVAMFSDASVFFWKPKTTKTTITMEHGPGLKMYFLLKI